MNTKIEKCSYAEFEEGIRNHSVKKIEPDFSLYRQSWNPNTGKRMADGAYILNYVAASLGIKDAAKNSKSVLIDLILNAEKSKRVYTFENDAKGEKSMKGNVTDVEYKGFGMTSKGYVGPRVVELVFNDKDSFEDFKFMIEDAEIEYPEICKEILKTLEKLN